MSSTSIVEVAKAAGVSTATVSRVLNKMPGVRGDTIARVREAVASLDYAPQRVRRGPTAGGPPRPPRRASRTGNIAVITVGQTHLWLQMPVMAQVVAGISRGAAENNLHIVIGDAPDPLQGIPTLERGKLDGAIVFMDGNIAPDVHTRVLDNLAKQLPTVWVMGMEVGAPGVDHVTYDNVRAGNLAHEYLRGRGCRELAFVNAYPWPFMRLRGQSFLNAAFDDGRPATTYMVGTNPMHLEPYGRRVVPAQSVEDLVTRLAEASPRPDGIFVSCDRLTAELYPLLIHRGLTPGKDFAVVSCDNEDIRLSGLYPRPATIDIGADRLGHIAVSRLVTRIQDPTEPIIVIQVAPQLVEPARAPAGRTGPDGN